MKHLRVSACVAFGLLSFVASASQAQYRGGGEEPSSEGVRYEEITDFELRSHPPLLSRPYEIIIPDTPFGRMVVCQLYDRDGELKATQHDNSGNGETRLFFSIKSPIASAKCAYVVVDLWIDS